MSKGSKLSKFLSPEELEFADNLPDVTVSIKDLKQQEKDGFTELKEDFKAVKVDNFEFSAILCAIKLTPLCNLYTGSICNSCFSFLLLKKKMFVCCIKLKGRLQELPRFNC